MQFNISINFSHYEGIWGLLTIPQCFTQEEHYNIVQYEIKTRPVSLAMLFSKLEEAEGNLSIEDYSVSQNTLDNVSCT